MSIRNHIAARWLATMLVCLVALSAQSWASQVHWSADDQESVAGKTIGQVTDNTNSLGTAGQFEAAQSDHCGHMDTHLVGLHQEPTGRMTSCAAIAGVTSRDGYQSIDHQPPVEPPIA